ncbi:sulfotransferase [Streptomyces sp. HNM1019]|uniref:sulfotransferase n=1 Tax=Streptomyces sp. HNM1019 TaxID=3424717 RepID=UPI003D7833C1
MTAPVFLLGAQRSGTTALAHSLGNAFRDAGGLFTVNGKLLYLLERWITSADLAARHVRADEILHGLRRRLPQGPGSEEWLARAETALRNASARAAEGSVTDPVALSRDILSDAYGGYARWGEKYNEYLLSLDYLVRTVPEARYLVLIRSPDQVARSMLRWSGDRPWNPRSTRAALAKWAHWNTQWLAFARTLPRDTYRVIRYDALCRGEETQRLEAFLQMELGAYLTAIRPRHSPEDEQPSLPPEVARLWQRLTDSHTPATLHERTQAL